MKPWEIKKTREKMKKMTTEKSVKIFFDLYAAGREMLRTTLKGMSEDELRRKLEKQGL